jgi:hypothetical protein
VPDTLRSRIARTPAVEATTSVGAASGASSAVKLLTSKFMLVSMGGMIAIASYFLLKPDSAPVDAPAVSPTPSVTVLQIDTPRKDDTLSVVIPQPGTSRVTTETEKSGPSQSEVDRMLLNLPEPESTVNSRDSIYGNIGRKRKQP